LKIKDKEREVKMSEKPNLRTDGVEKLNSFSETLKHKSIYKHPLFTSIEELFDRFPPFDLKQDEIIYRARKLKPFEQIDNENDPIDFIGFGRKDSFVPQKDKVPQNRGNFKGVPCLYASTSANTAIAEIRPYKENEISIAEIKIKKELKLFDLCLPTDHISSYFMHSHPFKDVAPNNLNDQEANYFNLKDKIACMFAIPYEFTENDEYLPTQYISEYIRNSERFDGIRYTSSLSSDGENIIIFDCKNEDDCQCKDEAYIICEPRSSRLYVVENVGYFARCWNFYSDYIANPSWAWKTEAQ
jgi:hypothetical protein